MRTIAIDQRPQDLLIVGDGAHPFDGQLPFARLVLHRQACHARVGAERFQRAVGFDQELGPSGAQRRAVGVGDGQARRADDGFGAFVLGECHLKVDARQVTVQIQRRGGHRGRRQGLAAQDNERQQRGQQQRQDRVGSG